jgi:hypothetical protein
VGNAKLWLLISGPCIKDFFVAFNFLRILPINNENLFFKGQGK